MLAQPASAFAKSTIRARAEGHLVRVSSSQYPESNERMIQPGHRGNAVVRVQRLLTELGLYRRTIDGIYTEETAHAVEAFQTVHNLPITGQVDRETWNRLHQVAQLSEFTLAEAADPFADPLNESVADSDHFEFSEDTSDTVGADKSPDDSDLRATSVSSSRQHAGRGVIHQWSRLMRSPAFVGVGAIGLGLCFYLLGRQSAVRSHQKKQRLTGAFQRSKLSFATVHVTESTHHHAVRQTKQLIEQSTEQPTGQPAVLPLAPVHAISPVSASAESVEPVRVSRVKTAGVKDAAQLLQDLESTDATQRCRSIWELGQRGTTEAIQPLLDRMLTADSQQRSLIVGAIAEISVRTLTPLNRALMLSLQDESSDVRKNAIRDIARVYELMGQVSTILRHAANDDHQDVRQTACWAIDQLNRLRTAPLLDSVEPLPAEPLPKAIGPGAG